MCPMDLFNRHGYMGHIFLLTEYIHAAICDVGGIIVGDHWCQNFNVNKNDLIIISSSGVN